MTVPPYFVNHARILRIVRLIFHCEDPETTTHVAFLVLGVDKTVDEIM